jgi:hypothetical protein
LTSWARRSGKLYAPERFLAIVRKYGWTVTKRPFISDSLNAIRPQIGPIMDRNLKTTSTI